MIQSDRLGAAHPGAGRGRSRVGGGILAFAGRRLRLGGSHAHRRRPHRAFGLLEARRLPRERRQAPRLGVGQAGVPVRGGFRQPRLRFGGFLGVLRRVGVGAQASVVLGFGLYLLQAALLHTWQSVRGEGGLRRLLQSALPALVFSLCMIYLATRGYDRGGACPVLRTTDAAWLQTKQFASGEIFRTASTRSSQNVPSSHSGE